MEEDDKPAAQPAPISSSRRFGRGRTALLAVLVALVAGAAGSLATSAFGYGDGPWHPGGFMDGPIDPAQIDRQVDHMMKHVAVEADATPDQQAKLVAIAQAAVKDLLPLRDKARADNKQMIDLFAASSIDRTAIERLRAEHIGLAETASKRIAQALGDAAEVLTPEQRRSLIDRLSSWHRG